MFDFIANKTKQLAASAKQFITGEQETYQEPTHLGMVSVAIPKQGQVQPQDVSFQLTTDSITSKDLEFARAVLDAVEKTPRK